MYVWMMCVWMMYEWNDARADDVRVDADGEREREAYRLAAKNIRSMAAASSHITPAVSSTR
jgi:hypothetical protein